MAISIQIKDAEFTNVIGSLSLPDRNGLVAEYIFGGSQAISVKNRAAPGLASMTPVGTPLYGSNYAEIKSGGGYGSVGFNTGLDCPVDATLIVVVRKDVGLPGWLHNSAGFQYNGFLNYTSAPLLYNAQSGTSTNVADLPAPAHANYAFFAGTMPQGGYAKLYGYTAGVAAEATQNTLGTARGLGSLMIGSTSANAGEGVAKMAYSAVFNRAMTAGEVADAYASLKVFLGTRGCVVS